MAERALGDDPPADSELLDAVLRAYGLRLPVVSALLDWMLR
jgi:hypothetical protein